MIADAISPTSRPVTFAERLWPGASPIPSASAPAASPDRLTRTVATGAIPGSILGGVPPSTSVATSQGHFADRAAVVLYEKSKAPLTVWPVKSVEPLIGPDRPGKGGGFMGQAVTKLELGLDVAAVNAALATGKPFSGVGTDFHVVGPIARKGDYDFALAELTPLAFRNWENGQLTAAAKQNLGRVLLNQEGIDHLKPKWLLGLIPETENHLLLTESARYLKNDLVRRYGTQYSAQNLPAAAYDNAANGFNGWMVNHLSQFTRTDFDEYNAKPYQAYAIKPIQNLAELAGDAKVKTAAQIVLDYASVRFAVQSSDLRRVVPFRRRHNYAGFDNLFEKDSQSSRYAMLAGVVGSEKDAKDGTSKMSLGHMYEAAMSTYRVPAAILDLMIDKGSNPYFATVRHKNTEITYAERNFVISAGGHHHQWRKLPFSKQENGIAMPTVVMLKDGGPNVSAMLRFLGRADGGPINNTGVYENFAFGIRPTVPEGLEADLKAKGKWVDNGPWSYLDMGTVYVAMHRQAQKSPKDYAPAVGFVEVVDKAAFPTLAAFRAKVEQANGHRSFSYYGANQYTTTKGKTIEFVMAESLTGVLHRPPTPSVVNQWLVRKVWDGDKPVAIETNLARWPLMDSHTMQPEADGQNNDYVVKADGTGQVLINNPHRNASLILSLADQAQPIRIESAGEIVDLARSAQITQTHTATRVDTTVQLAKADAVRYLSLKWQPGSKPSAVQVQVQLAGTGQWVLAEERQAVYSSPDHAFRTDFDLTRQPAVTAVRFVATGKALKLGGRPEVFQAFPA